MILPISSLALAYRSRRLLVLRGARLGFFVRFMHPGRSPGGKVSIRLRNGNKSCPTDRQTRSRYRSVIKSRHFLHQPRPPALTSADTSAKQARVLHKRRRKLTTPRMHARRRKCAGMHPNEYCALRHTCPAELQNGPFRPSRGALPTTVAAPRSGYVTMPSDPVTLDPGSLRLLPDAIPPQALNLRH